jgi:choline kinase
MDIKNNYIFVVMIVIITTSGIGSRLGELTNYTNKSLVRVGDEYAIDHIIGLYKGQNIRFIITVGHYGDFVQQYVTLMYPDRSIIFVEVERYMGPGSSLVHSLLKCKTYVTEEFIYHCCDCIIDGRYRLPQPGKNIMYLSDRYDGAQFSSVSLTANGIISCIYDKGCMNYDYIYIGVAQIVDHELFWELIQKIYELYQSSLQLSDIHVYREMMKRGSIFIGQPVEGYYDIGNSDSYISTNQHFKSSYDILVKNTESISFHETTVVKFFHNTEKNNNILERAKFLMPLIPTIYKSTNNFHLMEKIDSRPISKIYKHGLIRKLLHWAQVYLWIHVHNDQDFKTCCYRFYHDKTMERVKSYLNTDGARDYNKINGCVIGSMTDVLNNVPFDVLTDCKPYRYHGDFILDNILMRPNGNFCLIDWRDNFGGDLHRGDLYYDLAKLRHNIYFNHKNINDRLYHINEIEYDTCEVDMKCNYFLVKQLSDYDDFIKEQHYDSEKINILVALIWINMSALYEHPLSTFLFNFGKYNLYLELSRRNE